jgi:excisionase family DNA binding protein
MSEHLGDPESAGERPGGGLRRLELDLCPVCRRGEPRLRESRGMGHTTRVPSVPVTRRLLTPRQVAEQLQCSYSMVLALIRRGDLAAVYVGRLPRIREADLGVYIDRETAR